MRPVSTPIRRYELQALLEAGEGADIEFKRHFSSSEKIAKEIIALANTKGGYILFGVDDDGSVIGVRSEKSEAEEIQHVAQFLIEPPAFVSVENVNAGGGHDIVLVRVPESREKPHVLIEYDPSGRRAKHQTGTGYVRVGEQSVQASKEVMSVMRNARADAPPLRLSIGKHEQALFAYLEAHERITVVELAHLVNISRRRASKILVNMVRAGLIHLHTFEQEDFYTLVR